MDNNKVIAISRVHVIFCISFGLVFLSVIGLAVMVFSMNETLKKQQEILIKVPPELRPQIIEAFQNSAKSAKDDAVDVHKAVSIEIKENVKKQFECQETLLQKQMAQIITSQNQLQPVLTEMNRNMAQIITSQNQLQPVLTEMNRNIDSVVQADRRNHVNAEEAITMAKKVMEAGEAQLAMIYALNAINHESSNAEYLKFYNDLLLQKIDLTIGEIDQFTAVLDLAIFQIPASEVPSVAAMKTALMEKRSSMVSVEAEAKSKEVADQVIANIAELKDGRLAMEKISENGNIDETLLKERLETLSALLSDASLAQEERDSLSNDLRYATGLYSIVTTLSAAKNAIAKADTLASKDQLEPTAILTARNQLQTGNTLLSQIWSSDCCMYPEYVSAAQKLQVEIAEVDNKLNVIASAPAKDRIEKLVAECHSIAAESVFNDSKYTSRIERITTISKEFPQLLASIYDPELKKTLSNEVATLSPLVSRLSKNRYKAYQKWALNNLYAIIRWRENNTFVFDREAIDLFDKYILEINPALLLPDVNSLYNNLYQFVYNELPNKAEMQYKKATSSQVKQLEDF